VIKGKGYQKWDVEHCGFGDYATSADGRRSCICPGARARGEAGLRKKEDSAMDWDEMRIRGTNSSCGVLEDC
jgi:hypothetical protein